MKIVDEQFPNDNEVGIYQVKIEYTQTLDCCQHESEHPDCGQFLKLETDDGGGGKFIRFFTGEAGWSIDPDNLNDLIEIFNDFKRRITP